MQAALLTANDAADMRVRGSRVLLVLAILGIAAAAGLAFVTHAPNRLVSGQPLRLVATAHGLQALVLLPGVVLIVGAFLPQTRASQRTTAIAAASFIVALAWLAAQMAVSLASAAMPSARTSLGAGFWVLLICSVLALIDALRRLAAPGFTAIVCAALIAAFVWLAASGAFDQLSLAKEYANRREVFAIAVIRHLQIVLLALGPSVLIGAPLGILAFRRGAVAAAAFPVLNIVQTIPSIALFGLLMAPLAGLSAVLPALSRLGIGGIGLAPAVIALVLYALLPIVRNTVEGLAGVPAAAIEAARAMGMTQRQIFWRVELPLAAPVFLSGLRITAVQAIGLAAVAALIGAGGLGSIMFEGVFANAPDLTLLGAIPVIVLAVLADALFRVLAAVVVRAA